MRGSERVRFRRALALLGMTLILPGSAQLMSGSQVVGRAALRVVGLVVVGALASLLILGTDGYVELGLESRPLLLLQSAIIVLGLCWLALFVDAWRLGRPPTLIREHRLICAVMSLLLMAAVAAPAAYSASLLQAHRKFLDTTFPSGGVVDLYQGRLNILLLGGDGGSNRTGVRTDSITLASIDVASGRTLLFSLPRNLEFLQFPPGTAMAAQFPNGFDPTPGQPDFAFGIYTYGTDNPQMFPGAPDPGARALQQAVAQTLGVPVHYYALVNLAGFRSVVDAIGGVTINVADRLPIGGGRNLAGDRQEILGYIEPGLQKLDGYRALWYSRSRSDSTDYDRIERQRCMFGAILREADPLNVLRNYTQLTKAAKQVLTTDLSRGELTRLVDVATKAKGTKIVGVPFVPPLIDPAAPDLAFIRERVQAAIAKQAASAAANPDATPTAKGADKKAPQKAKKKAQEKAKKKAAAPPTTPGEATALEDTCRYE
ncbi:MAG: LCP family protein [Sporichthyaceae bacterium]